MLDKISVIVDGMRKKLLVQELGDIGKSVWTGDIRQVETSSWVEALLIVHSFAVLLCRGLSSRLTPSFVRFQICLHKFVYLSLHVSFINYYELFKFTFSKSFLKWFYIYREVVIANRSHGKCRVNSPYWAEDWTLPFVAEAWSIINLSGPFPSILDLLCRWLPVVMNKSSANSVVFLC